MAHPLCGADILTLGKVLLQSGLPSDIAGGLAVTSSVVARSPISAIEALVMERKLPDLGDMPPPVFILGHWRSGTTHLYNTMCQSREWGYVPPVATGLPWDLFGIAKVFAPLLERALPEHRYIDNIPVTPESPQEDEIALANMTEFSFYHGIYFPRKFQEHLVRGIFFDHCNQNDIDSWRRRFEYFMRKLYLHQEEKPLLIKNPVYTARVGLLREIFPNAKFIHIHRNPYDVFLSMQNFYSKLFSEFALQSYAHIDIDEVILTVYERMMRTYEKSVADIPTSHLIELRYEELDRNPVETIGRCYEALSLPGFESAKPKFEAYLSSIASFEKNKFNYDPTTAKRVEARLGQFIEQWNYEKPA